MKKILHVTMSSAFGGAETVILTIISELKNKFDFNYLCPAGDIEEILKKNNITYTTFSDKNIYNISKQIKEIKPDIIHAHDFTASILCGLLAKNTQIISHLHTDHKWIKSLNLKSLIYLLTTIKYKKVIVVSNAMAKEMFGYRFLNKKLNILLNPVDKKKIYKLANESIYNEKYDLAFLGRLSEYKNPLAYIRIVQKLKQQNLIKKAVIIGDGELKQKCLEKISELNLQEVIEVMGFIENPFPIISNSKILIMPSKNEALGLAGIESMVLGVPVIASNVGGLRDIIKNNENGFLCNNENEFVDNIKKVFFEKNLYNVLSVNSKKEALRFTDIDKYKDIVEDIYYI